jgi:transcription elongation factor Elf1
MNALDGNAIAGQLYEVFGGEMTASRSTCVACGATSYVAEAVVYMRGPGTVARCRACGEVHMVLVTIRGVTCVDVRGLAAMTTEEER